MDCSISGLLVLHHLPESVQVHVHWIGDAIQTSHPLMPSSPSALNFPQHQGFSNELAVCIRWPKYWSFSFSISPSNEYSAWISLKFELFDLCCSRDSQESYPEPQFEGIDSFLFFLLYSLALTAAYGHWKDPSFDYTAFVGRVMSLLFNTLSRFIMAFLPRSNCLLISGLQLPSTVILEPKKRKFVTTSTFSPSIYLEVMELETMILGFFIVVVVCLFF